LELQFDVISEEIIGDHCYHSWIVKGDWQKVIAEEYKKLRTETRFPVEPICFDGLEFDVSFIKERLASNTIPQRGSGNFDVVRSDFGEVVSYIVLEGKYQSKFGYKSVRDRELINLAGRGIDGVSIEVGDKIKLVLTETKVSSQRSSPPSVVDTQPDSMRNQHIGHNNDAETVKKIWDISRKATDKELQQLFFAAALCFEEKRFDRLDLITCCVLVRPFNRHTKEDFGSFKTNAEDFYPGKIRFLIICLPAENGDNLEEIIDNWYLTIKEGRFEDEQ
jgi:hypothetical protein